MEYCLSPYNRKGLPAGVTIPASIVLGDSTMRDGEQANVKYIFEEKLEIARRLDAVHMPEIQVGSLRSAQNVADAKAICALGLNAKIEIMTRATAPTWKDEVRQTVEFGAGVTHSMIPLSHWLRGAYGENLDDDALLERIGQVIEYARQCGAPLVNISLLDVTRTDEEYLKKTVQTIARAGAQRICLADTVGCATPEAITYIVKQAKSWLKEIGKEKSVKVRMHLHDDFGLVMANCMSAAAAGADMLDCCINGMGKRAGNANTVQLAIALDALYGIKTGLDIEALYDLSKFIEKLSGVAIPTNAPFMGDLVFADDSEAHIKGLMANPFAFQSINPINWGNPRKILIGKNSGLSAMKLKLEQLGIVENDEEKVKILLNKCHNAAAQKSKGAYLTDNDIQGLISAL